MRLARLTVFLLTFVFAATYAHAGLIFDIVDVVGTDLIDIFPISGFTANNDDENHNPEGIIGDFFGGTGEGVGNTNVVGVFKLYDRVAPIDIVFLVEDTGGVSEHFFVDLVFNDTGRVWDDYHFELGFGTGENFVPSGDDGLSFDASDKTPAPLALAFDLDNSVIAPDPVFSELDHMDDGIWWDGGSVLPISEFEQPGGEAPFSLPLFTFSIDVPDSTDVPFLHGEEGEGYLFTLRQYPSVNTAIPEPSTLLLLTLGFVPFLRRK